MKLKRYRLFLNFKLYFVSRQTSFLLANRVTVQVRFQQDDVGDGCGAKILLSYRSSISSTQRPPSFTVRLVSLITRSAAAKTDAAEVIRPKLQPCLLHADALPETRDAPPRQKDNLAPNRTKRWFTGLCNACWPQKQWGGFASFERRAGPRGADLDKLSGLTCG